MGLGYFFLFLMIAGRAGAAVVLLAAARRIWKRSRHRFLALLPVLLAVWCAAGAFQLLAVVWREPPWAFHF